MNRIILSGNLTREVEVRYTQSGKAYARAGLAVNRRAKDEVDFFDLVIWDKQAEFAAKYLRKGSRVIVEGRVQTGTYKDRNGGERKSYDVVVENIEFGDSKKKGAEPEDDLGADVPF